MEDPCRLVEHQYADAGVIGRRQFISVRACACEDRPFLFSPCRWFSPICPSTLRARARNPALAYGICCSITSLSSFFKSGFFRAMLAMTVMRYSFPRKRAMRSLNRFRSFPIHRANLRACRLECSRSISCSRFIRSGYIR
jgi:hypothetical protein